MTSSPPSVESADDLEAAVRKLRTQDFMMVANDGLDERRFHFVKLFDVLELIAADRKAQRQTIENAQAEIYSVWSHGGNLNVLQLNHLEAAMKELSKLEAGPQPKQEREPR